MGHKRVARMMVEEGLRGKNKGGRRSARAPRRRGQPADNVLDRRFAPEGVPV